MAKKNKKPLAPQQPVRQQQQADIPKETKRQFELFVVNGQRVIEQRKDLLLNQISVQDPMEGIAQATFVIIKRIEDAGLKAGTQLDPTAIAFAANVLMGTLMQMYEEKSGQKLTDEQRYQAFSYAVSLYLDDAIKTGRITKDEMLQMSDMQRETKEGAAVAEKFGMSLDEVSAAQGGSPDNSTDQVQKPGLLG